MRDARKLMIPCLLAGLALIVAACGTQVVTQEVPVEVTREVVVTQIVEVTPEATPVPEKEVPFEEQWMASAHADDTAEAFRHWDEDDPPVIPITCAKCHSTTGFHDFLGIDGTEFGSVENEADPGTVITCEACHNDVTVDMTSVVMPSGAELTDLGPSARCMQCHQGRESTDSVNDILAGIGGDEDTTSEDLRFVNIHYYAAAATLFGNEARGGYQFEGKSYSGKFYHVESFNECTECHNPHTLEVQIDACSTCHTGVSAVEDLRNVRMQGSLVDYDGDGDLEEGIYFEIEGLREMLGQAIQAYAEEVAGTPIAYSAESYPYFFLDSNANGEVDEDEAVFPNQFNAWSPRLLKAAYNFQTSLKDPGGYAHNAKYIIQLLYDSIETLNEELSSPVDLTSAHRNDPGHFDGTAEAFRHWDEEGVVPGSCSKCHSGFGLPFFLGEDIAVSQSPTNGLLCTTCHSSLQDFGLYEVEEVTFPSGATVGFVDLAPNLCLNCHQGRESTVSVQSAIDRADVGQDDVSEDLSFRNPHYFAAGATLFGSEVDGAYQYEGNEYLGQFTHVPGFDTCIGCHSAHALEVRADTCSTCHPVVEGAETLREIRAASSEGIDYDGDGDTDEGIAGEIETMHQLLYDAILAYGADTVGTPIVYDPASYPYYFIDTNENGQADPDEANFGNRYLSWTPRLLKAAYNYQYVAKDPGAFAHNSKYMLQVLYDSLQDLGVSVAGMTRP